MSTEELWKDTFEKLAKAERLNRWCMRGSVLTILISLAAIAIVLYKVLA
jgi:hypothetical protein